MLDFVFIGKHNRPTAVKGPETEPGVQRERHLGDEEHKMGLGGWEWSRLSCDGGQQTSIFDSQFINTFPARGKRLTSLAIKRSKPGRLNVRGLAPSILSSFIHHSPTHQRTAPR